MKPEPGVIGEDEFRDEWLAYIKPDGNYFDFADVKDKPPEFVWTLVEGDGPYCHLYAISGFHIVNVMGYCLTEVPWIEPKTAYWFFDDRTGYIAVLSSGEEAEDVGEDEADAKQRIEDTWGEAVISIRLHGLEEVA